jgi:putative oxidoreductase
MIALRLSVMLPSKGSLGTHSFWAIDCRRCPGTVIDSEAFVSPWALRTASRIAVFLGVAVTPRDRGITALQRLFSMFPNGWPGAALFLLRLVAGILLIYDGVVAFRTGPDLQTTILQSLAIGAGTLLILGLWTPIAGTLVIVVQICFGFLGTTQVRSNILLGALGAALAVLGPGIRSIDALRYGRKRFDIRDP